MKVKEIVVALRNNGYKLTPQRRAILKVIADRHDLLTPAAIYERVHDQDPTIGLVTIYRTLEVLTDLNLLCRVHAEDGCHSYLVRGPSGHHHHIVCSSCGTVADFTKCDIDVLERNISEETGFKISGHLIEFNGLCQKCLRTVGRKPRRPMTDSLAKG